MKVGILTWYKAINHGAVLQTYASYKVLSNLECKPVVLDYNWSLTDEGDKWNRILRRIKNFTPGKMIWFFNVKKLLKPKIREFSEFINNELYVGKKYDEEDGLDAVYIGSDMVFDITEGFNPYMYGLNVPSKYIFSYAASFGYTTYDELMTHPNKEEIVRALQNLNAIGYRDENTLNICKKVAPDVIKIENIDPVLCYGFEKEIDEWDTGKWESQNYILIYAYDSTMNDLKTINYIKTFAKLRNLKVVSCGYYHKWADECVPASPKEFVEMIKHAKYVITDTFHGTVFSLIMHKNFATYVRKNGFKITYLLKAVQLESRIATENFENILEIEPDYDYFDEWLKENQNKCRSYIYNNINEVKRGCKE